jgi:ATP-dependent Clp protease ATP-binding subunit ClpA
MPKINVYLPDHLAEQVRAAKLPVSAICQAALADALRHVAAATEAGTAAPADLPDGLSFPLPVTRHFARAVMLAFRAAAERHGAQVEPADLLQGLLHERESLTLKMVESLGVDPGAIQAELDARRPPVEGEGDGRGRRRRRTVGLSGPARDVLDAVEEEAARAGRPLITCAHLLLALTAERGTAGESLRGAGLDGPDARRAVAAMVSGLAYGRATPAVGSTEVVLADIVERLERIEARLPS